MKNKDFRLMSAVVLYRLEQELGSCVVRTTPEIIMPIIEIASEIEAREKLSRPNANFKNTLDLIAATYIDDLFKLLQRLTESTPEYSLFVNLKNLCVTLSLFEIRNAIAHPNRPFLECYWYRVAAIANDPLIQQLELEGVHAAFSAAIEGQIDGIPADWLSPPEWIIPNNLPDVSDHDITGLIGRPKETKDLEKYLLNPRAGCISIVAPGGVGKTALAVDVLEKACKKPEFNALFEAVVFLSLKLEKLTATGIEVLDAPSTITEIEEKITELIPSVLDDVPVATFQELKVTYENKRLLIFIDNLETLLRDNPTSFDSFQIDLPVNWRVLVTSRVNVNSATCLPIETLSDIHAKHLIRLYATRRNASELVKDEVVEKIIGPTRCNPLAIRLSVDAYILGSSLEFSVDSASRDVINFSYTNLLDVISKESIAVLECLFIQDPQTRIELSENLGSSIDAVAKGLHELTRTSLISRDSTQQQEFYSLYPSIRDLLLVSPRNPSLRAEVQKKVLKRREQAIGGDEKQAGLAIFHQDYVHNDLPAIVRDVLFESNKIYKNLGKPNTQDEVLNHIERMRRLKNEFPKIATIPRFIAKIYAKLGDNAAARSELLDALLIDSSDIQALIAMGRVEQALGGYKEAFQYFKKIIDEHGWNSNVIDEQTTRQVAIGYLLNQLYTGNYKGMLDDTINWDKNSSIKDVLGVYRARAWKRSVEKSYITDEKAIALNKSANLLDQITKEFGHPEWTHGTFHEIIEDIAKAFDITDFYKAKQVGNLLSFVENHIFQTFKENSDLRQIVVIANKLRKLSQIEKNPFRSQEWGKFIDSQGGQEYVTADRKNTMQEYGYIPVSIYHIPKPNSVFVFAKDEDQQEYFVHQQTTTNSTWNDWTKLKEGDLLFIRIEDTDSPNDDKAIKAKSTILQ